MKLIAAAALAVSLAVPAWAQLIGHEEGSETRMNMTILCDESSQLELILTAQKESFQAGVGEYQRLYAQRNEQGYPSCYFFDKRTSLPVRFVKTVGLIKGVKFPNSEKSLYILEVRWPFGNGEWVTGYIFSESPVVPVGDPV